MNRIILLISILLIFSMLLSACTPSAAPGTEATGESTESTGTTENLTETDAQRPASSDDWGTDKLRETSEQYLPFIYTDDGSLDDVVGEYDCKIGYLYVKDRTTGEITQVLNEPVIGFRETNEHLYCANAEGYIIQVDYTGNDRIVIDVSANGKIIGLDSYFNRLYVMTETQILQVFLYNRTVKTVVQGDAYASMYLLSDHMLVFETKDGKQYSMVVGNVDKSTKYDPEDCTLIATQDEMDALIKNAQYYELIKSNFWYKRALGCAFEKPEDISAQYYFYIGLEEKDSQLASTFTDEEKAYLQERSLHGGISNFKKMPVAKMNEALSVLNITVEDLEIPDNFIYYDKTDSYYVEHTDAYIPAYPFVTAVEENADGTVRLYWEADFIPLGGGDFIRDSKMVTTMQKLNDGTYRILSNVPVQ